MGTFKEVAIDLEEKQAKRKVSTIIDEYKLVNDYADLLIKQHLLFNQTEFNDHMLKVVEQEVIGRAALSSRDIDDRLVQLFINKLISKGINYSIAIAMAQNFSK